MFKTNNKDTKNTCDPTGQIYCQVQQKIHKTSILRCSLFLLLNMHFTCKTAEAFLKNQSNPVFLWKQLTIAQRFEMVLNKPLKVRPKLTMKHPHPVNIILFSSSVNCSEFLTQPAFTCSKLTIETLEQRCEICSNFKVH